MSILKSKKKTPKLWLFRAPAAKIQSPKLLFFSFFCFHNEQLPKRKSVVKYKCENTCTEDTYKVVLVRQKCFSRFREITSRQNAPESQSSAGFFFPIQAPRTCPLFYHCNTCSIHTVYTVYISESYQQIICCTLSVNYLTHP